MAHPIARTAPLALLLVVVQIACSTAPMRSEAADSRFEMFVLGVAQDGGLPHVGCSRPCCQRARRSGRRLHPACLGIHDRESGRLCLIEATPRIEPQLAMLHELSGQLERGRQPVDAVLLTHAHIGHYLGLAQFGKEVAATDATPVYVSPRFAGFLRANGPWRQMVELRQIELHEVEPGGSFEPLPGLRVEAIPVPHRDEYSDTFAYRIHGPARTALFVPDVDSWRKSPGLLDRLVEGVDVAYLDATFYDGSELPDRVMAQVRHPFVVETMELLAERAAERPGTFRLLHCNHTNPLLHDASLRAAVEARGFRLAEQGERERL